MIKAVTFKEVVFLSNIRQADVDALLAQLDDPDRLVGSIARRLCLTLPSFLDLMQDLRQEGWVGLLEACREFDPSQSVKLSTFASIRIWGAMIDFLRRSDVIGRQSRKFLKQIDGAVEELTATFLRTPLEEEIAAHLGMSLEMLRKKRRFSIARKNDAPSGVIVPNQEMEEEYDAMIVVAPAELQPDRILQRQQVVDLLAEFREEVGKTISRRAETAISLTFFEEVGLVEAGRVLNAADAWISKVNASALDYMSALFYKAGYKSLHQLID